MIPELDRYDDLAERVRVDGHHKPSTVADLLLWFDNEMPAIKAHMHAIAGHRNSLLTESVALKLHNKALLADIADLQDKITDLRGKASYGTRIVHRNPVGYLVVEADESAHYMTWWEAMLYRWLRVMPKVKSA